MSDNKEFGFDILEKSNMTTIEEIGTDKMSIEKKEMDRILNNTMKKYEKKKQEITSDNSVEKDEGSDSVSGVELHERRNISHLLYIVLCSAAALVLTVGSLVMLNHNKDISPNPPEPVIEAATHATGSTSLSITKTTVSSTAASTGKETGTQTKTETTTYTSAVSDITTTTMSSEQGADESSEALIYNNTHAERTDITQEELDNARNDILNEIMDDEYAIWHIQYTYFDVNNDKIPELFISYNYIGEGYNFMFIYDGEKYISPLYKTNYEKGGRTEINVNGGIIKVCPEDNLIFVNYLLGWEEAQIIRFDKDNEAKTICEYYGPGYYNDEIIENRDPGNQYSNGLDEFNSVLTAHKWQKLEFTEYAAKNNAASRLEEESNIKTG